MAWRYCCIVMSDFRKRFTIFLKLPTYMGFLIIHYSSKPITSFFWGVFLNIVPEFFGWFGWSKGNFFSFFKIRLLVCSWSLDSSPLIILLSNRYLDHPVATGRFSVKKSELCCWIEKHSSSSWRDKLALNFLTGN